MLCLRTIRMSGLPAVLAACSLLCACAAGETTTPDGGSGGLPDGGGAASGGSVGSGGRTSSGGRTGQTASGGAPGTGGSDGGTTASGGAGPGAGSGGMGGAYAATGGVPGSGGSPTSSGGATASGGRGGASGGGKNGSGGSATGGGGRSGMGGAGARGGASGAGGRGAGGGTAPPILKKFVGNIDTRGQIRSDFTMFWNQISPENAGKWGSVERTRNQMSWSAIDTMYKFAKDNHIPFKQHNFVWGSQQPSWLSGLSQADQRAEVEEWIRLFCERYPDTDLIDVVNEPPPHTTPPYMAALGGAGSSGYDWIVQAFKWAHQYCPNSILILNDYNNIEYASDNSHTIDIVNSIKKAGAPINAVGAQAHGCATLSASTVKMYIDKIASQTGLPVYISEYDLNIADDNQQKSVMQSQFPMFWDDANVKGITIWGYIEGATWVANSGLMSSSGAMRPAMTWLMDFLGL